MDERPRYDRTDIRGWAVISTGVGLLATTFALAAVLFLYLQYSRHREITSTAAPVLKLREPPPEPRQQVHPVRDYQAYMQGQMRLLDGYGWVDRSNRIVRIPVQRAMELAAEQGLPQFQAPPGVTYPEPRAGTLVTGFPGGAR